MSDGDFVEIRPSQASNADIPWYSGTMSIMSMGGSKRLGSVPLLESRPDDEIFVHLGTGIGKTSFYGRFITGEFAPHPYGVQNTLNDFHFPCFKSDFPSSFFLRALIVRKTEPEHSHFSY
jgi:hypothetical protein